MENIKNSKALVPRSVLLPFILVTSLFALWGFANAVTDPMVKAFKTVLELTNAQASWVQMAFYGGYFCTAIPAALFMRRFSYKKGILLGLGLYATGALLFYPAATSEQFWFFCLGLYVLTIGLAFLETAANPYALAMGSKENATQRLNLAQSFNPVGLIAGLLIAKYVVYDKLKSLEILDQGKDFGALEETEKMLVRVADLAVIRNPYVILGLTLIGVFVLFLVSKMPQAKDEGKMPNLGDTFFELFTQKKYVLGVLAQVCYVGAQIMVWTYVYQYADALEVILGTDINAFNFSLTAFILFAFARFLGTLLLRFFGSGRLLFLFAVMAALCTLGVIFMTNMGGLFCMVAISFFMSLMFPTIYGIALNGLTEEQAKVGSAGLIMAIVGGALFPFAQGAIIDMGGSGFDDVTVLGVPEVNISFVLSFVCFLFVAFYGYYTLKNHPKI